MSAQTPSQVTFPLGARRKAALVVAGIGTVLALAACSSGAVTDAAGGDHSVSQTGVGYGGGDGNGGGNGGGGNGGGNGGGAGYGGGPVSQERGSDAG
ncbi:MAG TPA: hypothetical protein VLQ92_08530 [Candidatus Limnocylindrales bacterium]|nr:hypothetical protein [Candidatus Limnocylindrales bacterium]